MPDKDTDKLFEEMMAGVKPLTSEERVSPQANKPSPKPKPRTRDEPPPTAFIERDYIAPVDPEERLHFHRPGLQHRAWQRLKRGEIRAEATLDLHGQTIAEAGESLAEFLREAQAHQCRCVMVVHGKGHRSQQGKPVLKSQVNHWLRQHNAVLGFCSAQPRHGGAGAVYVLLRRSA